MTASREFKNAIYGQIARIGKSLASGPRLEILDVLCQGPRTVEALARQVEQPVANTSHHLQVLRRAGLVEAERAGVRVTYRLTADEVAGFFRSLRQLAEAHLLEIDALTERYLGSRAGLEAVDRDRLLERAASGEVTLLDVRPPEEYAAGHLPGALSIPLGDLERRLGDLPTDREIVAYCRGPYCVMALDAVELLRERGYRASRMAEGVPDWQASGLPVEASAAGDEERG